MADIEQVDAVRGAGEAIYLGFVKVNQAITALNTAITKLAGIETGATADQIGPEIKALLEALVDKLSIETGVKETATKKVLTSDERAKLAGIEAAATADQTEADILTLLGLAAAEVDQVGNLGDVTVSSTQWGYLGGMNQGVVIGSVPAFQVIPAAEQTNIAKDGWRTVVWGTEIFDIGGNFAANTFTAPITGKYHLNVGVKLNTIDTAADWYKLEIITSNRTYGYIIPNKFSADTDFTISFGAVADMDADDTAYVRIYQSGGTTQTDISVESWFSGALVA